MKSNYAMIPEGVGAWELSMTCFVFWGLNLLNPCIDYSTENVSLQIYSSYVSIYKTGAVLSLSFFSSATIK